jgi:glycerol uptake facilitator protein
MIAYLGEFIGTAIILIFGAGVVANVVLQKTLGNGQNQWFLITTGWGMGVFVAVYSVGNMSGAHLNPAVSLALALAGKFSWSLLPGYVLSQILGAMTGSWLAYQFYKSHADETTDEGAVKGMFCTGPAIPNTGRNLFNEIFGTFILVFGIFRLSSPILSLPNEDLTQFGLGSLEAFPVGILVWVIGISLGGATGYAINPARDLGPRIVYALLPRPHKNPDWSYSWIPVVGPLIGAVLAFGLQYLIENL